MRIWLAVEPVDFRKGIDGLAQVCRQHLKVDPMAGALVVFSSRRRKALKCLVFDGQGFWLCQKRLSTGRFAWWPTDAKPPTFMAALEQKTASLGRLRRMIFGAKTEKACNILPATIAAILSGPGPPGFSPGAQPA